MAFTPRQYLSHIERKRGCPPISVQVRSVESSVVSSRSRSCTLPHHQSIHWHHQLANTLNVVVQRDREPKRRTPQLERLLANRKASAHPLSTGHKVREKTHHIPLCHFPQIEPTTAQPDQSVNVSSLPTHEPSRRGRGCRETHTVGIILELNSPAANTLTKLVCLIKPSGSAGLSLSLSLSLQQSIKRKGRGRRG